MFSKCNFTLVSSIVKAMLWNTYPNPDKGSSWATHLTPVLWIPLPFLMFNNINTFFINL